jgi:putative mRNA 3-end processing factor
MSRSSLLRLTSAGLYCEIGGFHVDPWSPVARAVVTHAHADHFVAGCRHYLTARPGAQILRQRLGSQAAIQPAEYGETIDCFGVSVSLHPAGHILGSAQVRVEHRGDTWVVSGDYKVAPDPTCAPFEPIRCRTFVTESTFGHPFFAWDDQATVFHAIHAWWRENQQRGMATVLYAYSLGKAQRLLAGLDASIGPVLVHPDIEMINELYRAEGVGFLDVAATTSDSPSCEWSRSLVILPPGERRIPGITSRGPFRSAFVSGWMALPNGPQQRRVERGFALSDHADHREILSTVAATEAETILVTHGYIDDLVAMLRAGGHDAQPLRTPRCHTPPAIPARQREFEF